MDIQEYVSQYTIRGECKCGKCIDTGNKPDPAHSVNMVFFKVALDTDRRTAPMIEDFEILSRNHDGEFTDVDPFDGEDHSYIELGAWIGDQGMAIRYMALGVFLGVFNLLSPHTILGLKEGDPQAMKIAGMGLLAIQKKKD